MNEWSYVLVVLLLTTLIDGYTTGLSLLSLMSNSNNLLAYPIAISGAIAVTGIVTFTKYFLTSNSFFLIFLWFIAVGIDAYANIVCVIFYVIRGNDLKVPVDYDKLALRTEDLPQALLTFSLTILITGAAIAVSYVQQKKNNN